MATRQPARASRRLLVVDPDGGRRQQLRSACEREGCQVFEVEGPRQALASLRRARPGLVLLSLDLPGGSGLELCRELRRRDQALAVILIGAGEGAVDAVAGLEIGADDFLGRPLRLPELAARVGATLRRVQPAAPRVGARRLEFGDLAIDLAERRVVREGREVALTRTEFDLLVLLAASAGRVLSREALLERIWSQEAAVDVETRVIDVHVRNLRLKVEREPSKPAHILAVPGIGYRFA